MDGGSAQRRVVAVVAGRLVVGRAVKGGAEGVDGGALEADTAGEITKVIKGSPEVFNAVKAAAERMWRAPSMGSITGAEFTANPRGVPRLKGEPKLPRLLNGAGALSDLVYLWEGVKSIIRGDQPCDVMGDCPVPETA
ncbi:hypothetical protein [Streptomyces sp. NPDC050804]|uniref:hypothetical protein n=1 Tax=Streptomyces sp. NPDC050804 TaxID=3154745 RepID=UPI003436A531